MFNRTTLSSRVARLESEVAGIRRLYDKTLDYGRTDPETALMNARKAAEAVCARVFEHKVGKPPKSLTLQPLIEKLTQLDAVPEQILIALRTIQNYGNFGSHHQTGEPQSITPEFAQPCLQALGTVVRWYCEEFEQSARKPPAESPYVGATPHNRDGWKGVPIWALAGGTLFLILTLPSFLTGFDNGTRSISLDSPSAVTSRRQRLAILPFEPLSNDIPETSGYEEGIVRILEKPLKASPHLDVVERADIDKAIDELKLSRDRMFDQSTVSRIGRLVGAQKLLLGSYFKIGNNLRIDARVVDTETGRILSSVAREGQPDDLTALVTAIGEEIAISQKPTSE